MLQSRTFSLLAFAALLASLAVPLLMSGCTPSSSPDRAPVERANAGVLSSMGFGLTDDGDPLTSSGTLSANFDAPVLDYNVASTVDDLGTAHVVFDDATRDVDSAAIIGAGTPPAALRGLALAAGLLPGLGHDLPPWEQGPLAGDRRQPVAQSPLRDLACSPDAAASPREAPDAPPVAGGAAVLQAVDVGAGRLHRLRARHRHHGRPALPARHVGAERRRLAALNLTAPHGAGGDRSP